MPAELTSAPAAAADEPSTISFFRLGCSRSEVPGMLGDLIRMYSGKHGRTLVFVNTKKDCLDLSLNPGLKLDVQCLHGDMRQEQREATMKSFHANGFSVLLATDVAVRGLDIPRVDLVIQAAPPVDLDAFFNRAGRVGRADRKGVCVLLHAPQEQRVVERIERHAKIKFESLPPPSQAAAVRDVTEDLACVEHRATERVGAPLGDEEVAASGVAASNADVPPDEACLLLEAATRQLHVDARVSAALTAAGVVADPLVVARVEHRAADVAIDESPDLTSG
jgi:superfamily II DNA/RNA helicase